jgi:hypothetical protein
MHYFIADFYTTMTVRQNSSAGNFNNKKTSAAAAERDAENALESFLWWEKNSLSSWNILMYQTIRTFMLARVTPKAVTALMAATATSGSLVLQQSAVATSNSAAGGAKSTTMVRLVYTYIYEYCT